MGGLGDCKVIRMGKWTEKTQSLKKWWSFNFYNVSINKFVKTCSVCKQPTLNFLKNVIFHLFLFFLYSLLYLFHFLPYLTHFCCNHFVIFCFPTFLFHYFKSTSIFLCLPPSFSFSISFLSSSSTFIASFFLQIISGL